MDRVLASQGQSSSTGCTPVQGLALQHAVNIPTFCRSHMPSLSRHPVMQLLCVTESMRHTAALEAEGAGVGAVRISVRGQGREAVGPQEEV